MILDLFLQKGWQSLIKPILKIQSIFSGNGCSTKCKLKSPKKILKRKKKLLLRIEKNRLTFLSRNKNKKMIYKNKIMKNNNKCKSSKIK